MEEDYQDAYDDYYDQQDTSQDLQEAQLQQFEGYPTQAKPTENILTWFWKIVNLKDSTKVANIDKTEIGASELSVRGLQRLSLICKELGESTLGAFFSKDAEVILSTSMSKNGWLVEQSISQKRFQTRARKKLSGEGWRVYKKKGTTEQ